MFKSLADEKAVSERVERSARRFMTKKSGSLEALGSVKQKFNALDSEIDKAEIWAVYRYTKDSGPINSFAANIKKGRLCLNQVIQFLMKQRKAFLNL